jgi:hypothetical protein
MGMSSRPQSQRSPQQNRGTDTRSQRGQQARVRNTLKSDRDNTMMTKPVAQRDQYGSRHNEDDMKGNQKRRGRVSNPAEQNFAQRESAQDIQPDRGGRNKLPGRRRRKSGSPKE